MKILVGKKCPAALRRFNLSVVAVHIRREIGGLFVHQSLHPSIDSGGRVDWRAITQSFLSCLLAFVSPLSLSAQTALVRHAPTLNGTVDGSLQQMTGESVALNGGAVVTGDLFAPGTPVVQLNSAPNYGGTLEGSGSVSPSGYYITLNGQAALRHVIRRTNPLTLPTVAPVPTSSKTASVTVNAAGQSIAWSTLKNLTLNGAVGQVTVPAGTYGNFIANNNCGFTLGVAGATQPSVYNLQALTLNGRSALLILGPVIINLANGLTANSTVGMSNNPAWLTLKIKSGGLTLNSSSSFHGYVLAPSGTVIINANSRLVGGLTCDRLIVNGSGLVKLQPQQAANQSPAVSLTAPVSDSSFFSPADFMLAATASDSDGSIAKVEFFQGTAKIGQSTSVPYTFGVTNLTTGSYTYFARATDNLGVATDSSAISITVTSPNQLPTVALAAPADGAVFTAPGILTLIATATDSDGTIDRVDFFQGGALIGSAASAPYSIGTTALSVGTYIFSAKAFDNAGASKTSDGVTVTVIAPNQAPTVSINAPRDDAVFDDPAEFVVNANAEDSDGSIAKVELFLNGTLTGTATQMPYGFSVGGLAVGTYDFVARATDNLNSSADSTPVRITVAHVNDAPVANGLSATATEDNTLVFTLTGSDPDQDLLAFAIVTPPTHGTWSGTLPNLTYIPAPDFSGSDSFTFKVNDGALDSAPATVQIIVTPVNDAPVAFPRSVSLDEDTSAAFILTGADVDGPAVTFVVNSGPAHGTLSGTSPNLTYTPISNFNGIDSLVFSTFDGQLASVPVAVSFTVAPRNDAPSALPQSVTTPEDTIFLVALNATDVDGDPVTYAIIAAPQHGVLSGTGAQRTYSPAANFTGTDSFTFKANDGALDSVPATIDITITPENDAPTAAAQAVSTPEDIPRAIALSGSDPDGDALTFAVQTQPAHGTLDGTAPNFTYTPAGNFSGADSFTFTAHDATSASAPATVSITVAAVNDVPVALSADIETAEDTPMLFDLTGGDPDGDPLTFVIGTLPTHGTIDGALPHLTYTPAANFHGADTLVFKVSDGVGESAPAEIRFTVAPVNDAPTGADLTASLLEDGRATFVLPGADPDGDTLAFALADSPAHGVLSGVAPNLTYTPAADFNGSDALRYRVGDGILQSGTYTVTLEVAPVNDTPAAIPQSAATPQDTPVDIVLTGADIDNDALTFAVTTQPTHGALSGTPPNLTYTPATNYEGSDAIGFKVSDGLLDSASANVTIAISAPNMPPVPNAGPDQQIHFTPTSGPRPQGRILVNHDEWTLTDQGFANSPYAGAFARNIADFLTGGKPGAKFLAYTNVIPGSVEFIYTGDSLATVMQQAGHTWVRSSTIAMTLANLQQYDAVFLGANLVDNQVLIDYVEGGGSVYLSAGTHWCGCDAAGEAALWNTFLEHFGLHYNSPYNGIGGTLSVFSDHPIFHGIQTLYFGNGNSVSLMNRAGFPYAQIPYVYNGQGLFGLYGDFANQVFLHGSVTDDGRPNPPATVTSQWTQIDGPAPATITAPNSLTTRVELPVNGSYTFRLTVNDGAATSTDDVVVVANIPPEVDAGPDQSIADLSESVALVGTVTDDDVPHASTLLWKSVAGPGTVTFASVDSASTTAIFSAPGRYVLEFSADDGLETAKDFVEISAALVYSVEGPGNMAAWWPGNGNTSDLVGGHDAVLKNEAAYSIGEVSLGFSLDGANDYLEVPASSDLSIGVSTAGLTVELWAKPGRNQDVPLVQWATAATEGLSLRQWNGGVGLYAFLTDTAGTGHQIEVQNMFTANAWIHVALTYDKVTGLARLYRNGVLVQERNLGVFTPQTTYPLQFGSLVREGRYYQGILDEISFYNRPLALAEIQAIFNAGSAGKAPIDDNAPPAVNAGPDVIVISPTETASLAGSVSDDGKPVGRPLVINWSKVDGPGTVAFADMTIAATTATFSIAGTYTLRLDASDGINIAQGDTMVVRVGVAGSVQPDEALVAWWPANGEIHEVVHGNHDIEFLPRGPAFAPGETGQGFSLNGSDDYGRTPEHSDLNIGTSSTGLTIELWAKPGRNQDVPLVQWATATTEGLSLRQWNGGVGLYAFLTDTAGGGHQIEVQNMFTANTWTHVALTYDKVTGLARLYRNGVLVQERNLGVFTPQTTYPLQFGSLVREGRYYQGILDEINFYTRPLSLAEIQAIFNAGAAGKTPSGNQAPVVNAGTDVTIINTAAVASLAGSVSDDGKPTAGTLNVTWSKVDGPGVVSFSSPNAVATTATFSASGIYVLRLDANDGELQAQGDTMVVRVGVAGSVQPDEALVAWWPANGEIHEVVHGNHDIEFLPRGPAFAPGEAGQGFSLNGSDDYGRTPAHNDLNIGTSSTGLTIELWAKPGRNQDVPLVQWATASTEGLSLRQWNGGVGLYAFLTDTAGGGHQIEVQNMFTANTWTHVALTYDKVTGLARLYRNGVLVQERNLVVFTPQTTYPLQFGSLVREGRYYQGILDEISFYTRPLSIAEITAIYQSGTSGKTPLDDNLPPVVSAGPDVALPGTGATAMLAGTVTDDNKPFGAPATQWTLVEGPAGATVTFANATLASTTATFSSPGTYLLKLTATEGYVAPVSDLMEVRVGTATVEPSASIAAWWPGNGHPREIVKGNHDVELYNGAGYGAGQVSQGFTFDGVNDHGRVAAHADHDIGASAAGLTIEFWTKPGRVQDAQNLLTWGTSSVDGVRLMQYYAGTGLYVYLPDVSGANHTFTITGGFFTINAWQHVAVTYDKVTGFARLYRNGVLISEQNFGVFVPRTNLPLTIGASLREGNYFQGTLDEVSLYTRPLTITEITAIYTAGVNGKTPLGDNSSPIVDAGPDAAISSVSNTANLVGSVIDDNKPFGPPAIRWTLVGGPVGGTVTFADATLASTTAIFSTPGTYLLKLTATEGYVAPVSDLMEVRVGTATTEPSASIAAWWPGNGHAREIVHENAPIELYNGASYVAGQVSQGFTFDGVNDHGRVAAHADHDIGASAAGLTIEFWTKPGRAQDAQNLLTWGTSGVDGVRLMQYYAGTGLYVYLPDVSGANHTFTITGGFFTINAWQHVAVTYDKVTGLARLYRNGVLISEQNFGVFAPRTDLPLTVGASLREGNYYQGILDEISFYTRPLSITEIATIYEAGTSGKTPLDDNLPPVVSAGPDVALPGTGATAMLAGTVTDDNKPFGAPAIQWTLVDGPVGGTVTFADATIAATTATFSTPGTYLLKLTAIEGYVAPVSDLMEVRVATATVESSASIAAWWPGNGHPREVVYGNHDVELYNGAGYGLGEVSQGFTFDGVNDHGRVAGHSELDIGSSAEGLTIELWAKPARAQDNQTLVAWGSSTAGGVRLVQNYGGTGLYFYLQDTAGADHPISINGGFFTVNVWQHVAVTYNRVTGFARIYRNGVLLNEQNLGLFTPRTNQPLTFGGDRLGTGGFYQGSLDEITFYTRPLTIAEIAAVYNAGAAGKTPVLENTPAIILLDTPISGSSVRGNASLTLSALVTDTDGTVSKVEFFDGITKLGETSAADIGQPARFSFTLSTGLSLGTHIFTARATDNGGALTTSSSVTLNVVPVLPAVALTSPVANATVPANASLTLAAAATYSVGALAKVEFFDGATKLGESSTPVSGSSYELNLASGLSAGAHTLTAKVTAVDASIATSASVHITANVVLPVVSVTSPADGSIVVAAVPVSLTASATTAQGSISKVEFFDGATRLGERVAPDVSGGSIYTFTVAGGFIAGTHSLTAKATTSTSSTATSTVVVITAGTYTGDPVVEISTPDDGARISAPTSFTGIVAVPSLTGWSLDYRLKAADGAPVEPWTPFATGSNLVGSPAFGPSAASPAWLGTFDPTRLINGIYEVQLRAVTASLNIYIAGPITVVVEGNMKIGAFTLAFEDLKVPVAGIPISATRTYDSRDTRAGDFGLGWRLAIANIRVQKNRHLGTGWYQTPQEGSGIQFYNVDPIGDRIVTVTMPDGESHRFRAGAYVKKRAGDPDDASFAVVNLDGLYKFYPLGDTTSSLEPVNDAGQLDDHFWIHGTGDQDLRTDDASDPFAPEYNPTRFRLTTKDGTRFLLDERLGLLRLEDLNGNTLVLNRDTADRVKSVVSTLSSQPATPTSITIHRDANGRVDYIRDPAGHDVDYAYDAQGRLSSFTNRALDVTQFKYENAQFPNYLTKILDPRGVAALRTEFDASGRMIKQIDADGQETVFTHGVAEASRFEKVKDRLGNESTFYYDDRGNVTTKIDPLGAQTTFSYYPDTDRVKFETDHYGNVKSMAYDARGNVTVQTTGASLTEDPANPTTGYITRTNYNALGAPTRITDPSGRVQTFTYDLTTNNLLSNTVGTGGSSPATTTYDYNADGTLDMVTDALGNVTSNTYDYSFSDAAYPAAVKQVMVTVFDFSLNVLRTSRTIYDAQQNMLAQIATRTLAAGGTEDIVTKYIYDAENRLKATIMPDGKISETRYTSFGQADKSILWKSFADYQAGAESAARVTSYTYDNRGNVTVTTNPDGTTESTGYDLANRREWSQDRLGRKTYFQYDKVGRLRFTYAPDATPADLTDNPYTETLYDLAGRVTDTYDELRHRTSVVYYADGTPDAGRRKQTILATGYSLLTTSYSYDASGNVRFVTDPRGNTVETQYDDQGRPTTVVYPATDENPTTTTTTTYDLLGHRIATTDQEGKVTRYRYDALGRLIEVRQYIDQTLAASDTAYSLPITANGLVSTRCSYDEVGNQLSQTDARGNVTNYRYDTLGRRTQRILPDNSTESLQYDEWGNLWKRTDFNGKTTTFTYDTLNRLKSKSADPTHPSLIYSHAIARVDYDYDANGARTAARTYATGNTLLYSESTPHDERGRLISKITPLGTLSYDYYANGLLKDVISSNESGVNTGYRYDDANRLSFVDDASGVQPAGTPNRTTSYTYNANGSLQTVLTPNGVTHSYQYDTLNRLRSLDVSTLSTQLRSYTYTLNPSGHRREITENNGRTVNYAYDGLYRLISETVAGVVDPGQNGTITYGLDKVGNRETRTSSVAPVTSASHSFNQRDWLSGDSYDANGNTHTTPLTTLGSPLTIPDVYDFEDRLIVRTRSDGTTINLSYDADGVRKQKAIFDVSLSLASVTSYFTDTNNLTGYAQVLEENVSQITGSASQIIRVYTYGSSLISVGRVIPNASSMTVSYYQSDGLGSVRSLTDATGTITDTYDYDAFGILIRRTGTTANDYLYRGEQFDADLGMCSLRSRFYNQSTGRFWNQDSYEGSASDPGSLHKYLYASADGVNNRDPSGHFSLTELSQTAYVKGLTLTIAYPRITFGVAVATATLNLTMFLADEQYRLMVIASSPPDIAMSIMAADAAFLFNSGTNLFRGTLNLATRASQLGLSISFRNPKSIKFLQAGISSNFKNGSGVQDLTTRLRSGQIQANSVEPIRVFEASDGQVFTLDHRRLYAFQQAEIEIPTVTVAAKSVADEILRKTDSAADGVNIILRGSNP